VKEHEVEQDRSGAASLKPELRRRVLEASYRPPVSLPRRLDEVELRENTKRNLTRGETACPWRVGPHTCQTSAPSTICLALPEATCSSSFRSVASRSPCRASSSLGARSHTSKTFKGSR